MREYNTDEAEKKKFVKKTPNVCILKYIFHNDRRKKGKESAKIHFIAEKGERNVAEYPLKFILFFLIFANNHL